MSPWPAPHLTADDLDAFHSGSLASDIRLHLETCESCRRLVAADLEVVRGLESLPSFAPGADFANRVMARVAIVKPARVPLMSFPTWTRVHGFGLAGGTAVLLASVVWSAANREAIELWLSGIFNSLLQTGWTVLRSVVALLDHPWVAEVRSAWLQPGRLVVAGVTLLLVYGSGVLALRRLLTPSAGPSSNARA